jgi:hypothetical protein
MELKGWSFDIEADNLYLQSTKIWYIRFKSLDGSRQMKILPFRNSKEESYNQVMEWIDSFEDGAHVVTHNGLGYDTWMLWKLLGIQPRVGKQGKDWLEDKYVQFVDCYVLSMFLNPNSPRHSLGALSGSEEDDGKIDYRKKLIEVGKMTGDEPKGFEFSFYHPFLQTYCDRDVDATIRVAEGLWKQAQEMYGDKWLHPSFRQMQKDYFLYTAQAYTGVKFDKDKALKLVEHIEEEMKLLKDYVDPLLPPRPLKTVEMAYYKQPAKPFTMSGEMSASMIKFLEKHNATIEGRTIKAYGFEVPVESNAILPVKLPMEIDDNAELKQYFIDSGWTPSDDYWNVQKGADGKPVRDANNKFIKTTPKINHAGKLCPNLLKLDGDVPKKVVKFLSYRNRLGVITGWLNNWRLEFDGRLSAEISGYAPTSRVKHKLVVNVPKAADDVLLGHEMRELFCVDKGNWYIGTDASALENRTLAGYTYKYDNGEFARVQLEGDPHSFNAFAFFPHLSKKFDIDNQENKENPEFKPWRNKAKTGAYLLAFGGGAPKLASSLGLSKSDGQAAFNNYWEKNKGLGLLKKAVEGYYDTTGNKKYIPAIDGRIVSVRGKNVLLSCLGQGCGAISMSYAACLMDNWLGDFYLDELGRPYYLYENKKVKRVSFFHDEYSWEVEDGVQDRIRELSVKGIVKAGEALKLALPLAAEGKMAFEGTWQNVH